MTVQLRTKHHLEFLSLKGGCKGSSESTLVKMPHCWKSHVTAHMCISIFRELVGTSSTLTTVNKAFLLSNQRASSEQSLIQSFLTRRYNKHYISKEESKDQVSHLHRASHEKVT